VNAKLFLKLGTSVRYLIDAQPGALLGGKHVLQNIDKVIELAGRLEFKATLTTGGFQELRELRTLLTTASQSNLKLDAQQAKELERVCRRVRDSLLMEGEGMALVRASDSLILPERVTLPWIFKHLSLQVWFTMGGALIATFLAGIYLSRVQAVREWLELEKPAAAHTPDRFQKPQTPEKTTTSVPGAR
jgi:hypothetical protein